MRVCLVGFLVASARTGSGVPRYAARLAAALREVAPEFPNLELTLVGGSGGLARKSPARLALDQLAALRARADLLHFFDLTGPLLRPSLPFVTTIHDASIAQGYERLRHAYKRHLYPWALRRARRVVAVSEFARAEAVRHYGIPDDKIAVVRSGPGLVSSDGSLASEAVPSVPYLLYVGDLTEKKNVAGLVRAFDRAGVSERLVLVGRPRDPYPELDEALAAASARERISVVDTPSDATIDALYRGATALLLPSRYEGFGFTPLEAMARDCPVLATDIPAVREISGAGAMLLPVDDEAAWADGIRRVTGDERLRAELREKGRSTVGRYSWAGTARELCSLFLEAARS